MKKPLSCLDSSSFVFLPHHGYSNHPTLTSGPSAGRNDSLHRRPVRLRRYKRWAEDTTPTLEALSPSHVQLSKTLTCREAGFSVWRQTCFFLSTIAAGLYGSLDKFCVFWHTVFLCILHVFVFSHSDHLIGGLLPRMEIVLGRWNKTALFVFILSNNAWIIDVEHRLTSAMERRKLSEEGRLQICFHLICFPPEPWIKPRGSFIKRGRISPRSKHIGFCWPSAHSAHPK